MAFEYSIGIVGHPTTPDIRWTDEQLTAIKASGFTSLQLSIAWSSRPAGEVLNLEDFLEPGQIERWEHRLAQARAFGLHTLGHFGIPMGPVADATTCIMDPAVLGEYQRRLVDVLRRFPDLEMIMIYTYDQHAWLCSEFGPCPRCHGIPLHQRLAPFLNALAQTVRAERPDSRLWWEPWELSAGQTYAILDLLDAPSLGLILHHTIAEVEFVQSTDRWFRTLARLAAARGIPVIGEGFFGGAGEDIRPITHLPVPRLVYQQVTALYQTPGVVGIKEYYGLVPDHFSVNIALFSELLRHPNEPLERLLHTVALPYGQDCVDPLLAAWEYTALAMEVFPWDASWGVRGIFGWQPSEFREAIPTASWMTPAWEANRRAAYMVTDVMPPHPWLREDVALRARKAGELFGQAQILLADALVHVTPAQHADVHHQLVAVSVAARQSTLFSERLLAHPL